jgi:hypothetical protein
MRRESGAQQGDDRTGNVDLSRTLTALQTGPVAGCQPQAPTRCTRIASPAPNAVALPVALRSDRRSSMPFAN